MAHGDRGRRQPPVDAVRVAHPEQCGPPAAADVPREPEFPAVPGPRADRHADQVIQPAGGQQALVDRRVADQRGGVVDDQQPGEIGVSADVGHQRADLRVGVLTAKAGQAQDLDRHSSLRGSAASSRRRRFSAIGDSRPAESLVQRGGQGVRPEPAHLRGPGTLVGRLLLDHVVQALDLALGEIPDHQVQAVRRLGPAVQAVGQLAHELRAEPAVDVVVVERP